MGVPSATSTRRGKSYDDMKARLARRIGNISFSGRYHRHPRRIEDDYVLSKRVLGSGFNGEVIMAKSKDRSHQTVAVKQLKVNTLEKVGRRELKQEVENFLSM